MELSEERCFFCINTRTISNPTCNILKQLKRIFNDSNIDIIKLGQLQDLKICPACYHKLKILSTIQKDISNSKTNNYGCTLCSSSDEGFDVSQWSFFKTISSDFKQLVNSSSSSRICSACVYFIDARNALKEKLLSDYSNLRNKKEYCENGVNRKNKTNDKKCQGTDLKLKPLKYEKELVLPKSIRNDAKFMNQVLNVKLERNDCAVNNKTNCTHNDQINTSKSSPHTPLKIKPSQKFKKPFFKIRLNRAKWSNNAANKKNKIKILQDIQLTTPKKQLLIKLVSLKFPLLSNVPSGLESGDHEIVSNSNTSDDETKNTQIDNDNEITEISDDEYLTLQIVDEISQDETMIMTSEGDKIVQTKNDNDEEVQTKNDNEEKVQTKNDNEEVQTNNDTDENEEVGSKKDQEMETEDLANNESETMEISESTEKNSDVDKTNKKKLLICLESKKQYTNKDVNTAEILNTTERLDVIENNSDIQVSDKDIDDDSNEISTEKNNVGDLNSEKLVIDENDSSESEPTQSTVIEKEEYNTPDATLNNDEANLETSDGEPTTEEYDQSPKDQISDKEDTDKCVLITEDDVKDSNTDDEEPVECLEEECLLLGVNAQTVDNKSSSEKKDDNLESPDSNDIFESNEITSLLQKYVSKNTEHTDNADIREPTHSSNKEKIIEDTIEDQSELAKTFIDHDSKEADDTVEKNPDDNETSEKSQAFMISSDSEDSENGDNFKTNETSNLDNKDCAKLTKTENESTENSKSCLKDGRNDKKSGVKDRLDAILDTNDKYAVDEIEKKLASFESDDERSNNKNETDEQESKKRKREDDDIKYFSPQTKKKKRVTFGEGTIYSLNKDL